MSKEFSVTVEAFDRVLVTTVEADSRREAEETVLASIGFKVRSKRSAMQNGVYVGPDGTVTDALGNFVGIDQPGAAAQREP